MRQTLTIAVATAIFGLSGSACHDTCFLVVGCRDNPRVAVEGRIVEAATGAPVRDAALTLILRTGGAVDSITGISDQNGLFSLITPITGVPPDTLALRVAPLGRPGYLIPQLDCFAVSKWGDACVVDTIVEAPSLPLFRFVYRGDVNKPVANARVTFKRTGGSQLVGDTAADSVQGTTDAAGFVLLFGTGIYPNGLHPIIGTLSVDLPEPIGQTTRQYYAVSGTPRFNSSPLVVQPVGPILEYLMVFSDSASGSRVSGVEVRFTRTSGIPTDRDTMTFISDEIGRAFVTVKPLAQGSIVGDFTIKPKGATTTTILTGVTFATFDADSSIVLARWKIGAGGALYPLAPP